MNQSPKNYQGQSSFNYLGKEYYVYFRLQFIYVDEEMNTTVFPDVGVKTLAEEVNDLMNDPFVLSDIYVWRIDMTREPKETLINIIHKPSF